jgi:hypothetical protein
MTFLTQFFPGNKVPRTGQYWVVHLKHRLPYKAILTEGERFPICNSCDTRVLYEFISDVVMDGVSLDTDSDFAAQRSVWSL